MTYLKSMDVNSPLTAFGEVSTAWKYAIAQVTGIYDIVPNTAATNVTGSGSVTALGRRFVVSTGTTANSTAYVRTARSLQYRAGLGSAGLFTAVFDTPVANSAQRAGFFNVGDALQFGYDGTSFGVLYRRYGVAECQTITVTGAAAGATNLTLTLNSVAYVIPLTVTTTAGNAREIADWLTANQSVWFASQNGSTVVIVGMTDGARAGTYTYSHATSTGTFATTRAGVAATETWIPKASWNRRPNFDIDPLFGNVYRIKIQYLGFGDISFEAENRDTKQFEELHVIEYPSTSVDPSLGNPSMWLGAQAISLGSTTDLTVTTPSLATFMEGERVLTATPNGAKSTKTIGTTSTPLLTLRNRIELNGFSNAGEIQVLGLTLSSESTRISEFDLYLNPTLTAYNYGYYNQNTSIAETDTSATALAGGRLIGSYAVAANNATAIDLEKLNIKLGAGETLTLAGNVSAGAAAPLTGTFQWYEEF